jgi:hypothetical protein
MANVEFSTNRITHTYWKIGPVLHQVVSGFRLTMRYIFVFRFRFILFSLPTVHKKKKNFTLSTVLSLVLALAISFQIRFVEFVSVVELLFLV